MKKTKRLLSLVIMLTMIIFNGSFLFVFAGGEEAPAAEPAPAAENVGENQLPALAGAIAETPEADTLGQQTANEEVNPGENATADGNAANTNSTVEDKTKGSGNDLTGSTREAVNEADNTSDAAKADAGAPDEVNKTIPIQGKKVWEDEGYAESNRPESIDVTLSYNSQIVGEDTVSGNKTDSSWAFEIVAEIASGVSTITLELDEKTVPDGYVKKSVTNPTVSFESSLGGRINPESLTYPIGDSTFIVMNHGNGYAVWTERWLSQAERDYIFETYKGVEHIGWKTEDKIEFYHVYDTLTKYGFTINKANQTITYDKHSDHSHLWLGSYTLKQATLAEIINEINLTNIKGTKIWDDDSNRDGIRPGNFTIVVKGSDGSTTTTTIEGEIGNDSWDWIVDNLIKYDSEGNPITYTVDEVNIAEGYTSSIDGTNITNTHAPETITISGIKIWNDSDDKDGIRPDSVKIVITGDDGSTYEATTDADWKWIKENLYKYANGKEITYTISEINIDGYTGEIVDNGDGTYTITNTHTPKEDPTPEPEPTPDDPDNPSVDPTNNSENNTSGGSTPQNHGVATGDSSNIVTYVILMITALVAAVGVIIFRRKQN